MWHTDETFLAEPPLGTFLHARIIPSVGGDTCFASMTAAYAALSAPMRRYLDGLEAEHTLSRTSELAWQVGNAPPERFADALLHERSAVHPVVRAHPESGAPALFVNPTYTRRIVGVGKEESDAVLQLLYRHAISERFVFRHRWQEGDLVVWDNRCTMHHALFDFAGRRRMHRVSMLGDRPAPPASA
jgi:taurine dioxygenase